MNRNADYVSDVAYAAEFDLPWEKLRGAPVIITGATGMIGSFLTDVLLYRNRRMGENIRIYAIGRSAQKARDRFSDDFDDPSFHFIECDVKQNVSLPADVQGGYFLHLASNTHPVAYASDPIGTITVNIIGLNNMLDAAVRHGAKRFIYASSNEIYGENRGDTVLFDEAYCGYIDCNTLRAGYPESKRCGEALCQAYRRSNGLDVVIPRFTRSYGPTMLPTDTKAISQFIRKAIAGEDIVLKSEGNQYYSYTYVADAVTGLLTVMLKGEDGRAYNISDEASDIRLKDLAQLIAECAGKRVVFELPSETERAGYSRATIARIDGSALKALGWRAKYNIAQGIARTIANLRAEQV